MAEIEMPQELWEELTKDGQELPPGRYRVKEPIRV